MFGASQSIKARRPSGSDILAVEESWPRDGKKMPVPMQELAILVLVVEAGDITNLAQTLTPVRKPCREPPVSESASSLQLTPPLPAGRRAAPHQWFSHNEP